MSNPQQRMPPNVGGPPAGGRPLPPQQQGRPAARPPQQPGRPAVPQQPGRPAVPQQPGGQVARPPQAKDGASPGANKGAPEEPRKYRYSTAQMNESSKWKKWASIAGFFLLGVLVIVAMSLIFNHFFFGDQSDNGPIAPHPSENGTSVFPQDKQDIDSACGRATYRQDNGALCEEACVPQFFKCCDPFDEFVLYNYTEREVDQGDDSNSTTPMRTTKTDVDERNVTFLDEYDDFDASQCSFDQDIRGCMSYAKCQALAGQIDPAPANLPDMCSFERLERDEDSCKSLCRKLDCCYSLGADNCLAEKFDLCMDYAPCQNLRIFEEGISAAQILPTAPRELDFECAWAQPKCAEYCDTAYCCSNPGAGSCYQFNFMSCLTYSPCTANAETETEILIPPQFSHVEKPPMELIYACNANHENILEPTEKNCAEYCEAASCCFAEGDANCFHKDPLGCVAWSAQCQVLKAKE